MEAHQEILKMTKSEWLTSGCSVCRNKILSGEPLKSIIKNLKNHNELVFCKVCFSLWCIEERYAYVIDKEKALTIFGISQDELKGFIRNEK